MSLPENDPHVRFLGRDSWIRGFITGLLTGYAVAVVLVVLTP